MPKPQLPSGTALACLSAALPTEEGPPTEFRIFPKGKFDTQKGDYVFDDAAAASVIAASQQWGNEYSLDYEHAVLANPPAPAPAAGWFGLEAREDGLWAVNVRWTDKAAAYLSAREYRYFSPLFKHNKEGQGQQAEPKSAQGQETKPAAKPSEPKAEPASKPASSLDVQPTSRSEPESAASPSAEKAQHAPAEPPPPKPPKQARYTDKARETHNLTERQQQAQQNAWWLSGDSGPARRARAAATFEERRDWMIWDWVQNNRNQTSVSFSEAVRRALGVEGITPNLEEHELLDETALVHMKADVLKIYNQTQAWFRERGVTHVKLRRGVGRLEKNPSTLRSFTNSSKVAREFGNAGEYPERSPHL